MKTNIELKKVEIKPKKNGGNYHRFETSHGWITVFEKAIADTLMKHLEKIVTVELIEETKGEYVNKKITKYYGLSEDSVTEISEEKVTADESAYESADKPQAPNKDCSFNTSYAKDIFIAMLMDTSADKKITSYKEVMAVACALVKQAKEAFK